MVRAKFGQVYADQVRRRRPRPGDKWHLDEVFVGINGRLRYLWRAVDQHGTVLDVLVQSRRNAVAAKRFFRKVRGGRTSSDDRGGSLGTVPRCAGPVTHSTSGGCASGRCFVSTPANAVKASSGHSVSAAVTKRPPSRAKIPKSLVAQSISCRASVTRSS